MDRNELVFKHYIPIILLILLVIVNYIAYISPSVVGVFPLKYTGQVLIPYRQDVSILVEDLLSGSQTLIRTNGIVYSLGYTSASCDSCVVYITAGGVDVYVLVISIIAFLLYYMALRMIGLNTRLLIIVVILSLAIFLSLFAYIEYYAIPMSDYSLITINKPIKTSDGVMIIDTYLEPDTLIAVNTSRPVIVAYASTRNTGGNVSFTVKAVNVERYSDYITSSKYNVLMLITLSNQSLPNFTYHKLTITYLRGDDPLMVYQPLLITIIAVAGVYALARRAGRQLEEIEEQVETKQPPQVEEGSGEEARPQ